jgi:ribosomal protein S18 acetylase RimI-like enzyme
MVSAGLGAWFGTFVGDRLVGDLGIFCSGELARYQSVQTHPDFRRRGIAGALVYQAAIYALEDHNLETLVIVAEADSPAQRLYQSIGFQFTEYQLGVWKAEEGKE